MKPILYSLFTILCTVCVSNANALFITDLNSLTSPTTLEFSGETSAINLAGPIQVGSSIGQNIELSGTPNTGLYVNPNISPIFIGNGTWGNNGQSFAFANDARPGSLIFSFNDGPVSSVGSYMAYNSNQGIDLIISALDASFNILESFNVTSLADIVATAGAENFGAFRGIDLGINNIYHFEITGFLPLARDLSFSTVAAVPIPAALWLMISGVAGLAAFKRKKQA